MTMTERERTIETLIEAGYAAAPQMGRRWREGQPWVYLEGWAESTATRREMLEALNAERRARLESDLRMYPQDLEAHDRQPVRLAMRRPTDRILDLPSWVDAEYRAGRIAEGYALVSVRGRGGRPVVGGQVSVAVPPEVLARVDAAASLGGVSRPEWIRQAIAERLERLSRAR